LCASCPPWNRDGRSGNLVEPLSVNSKLCASCPPSNRDGRSGNLVERLAVNTNRCEFCTQLIDSFKSLLADKSLDLMKNSLNHYCELTGDFKDECLQFIDRNLENFVDFVENKMDSEKFCHAVRSCHHQTIEEISMPTLGDLVSLRDPVQMASHLDLIDQNAKNNEILVNSQSNNLKNPLTCMVCRQVIVIIYSQLHKNATREHVEHLLAKACLTLHPKDKKKQKDCENKVVENAEIILNSFINHIPPDLVCLITGMCIPGQQLQPIKPITKIEDIESEDTPIREAINWGKGAKCFFCEKVVGFLFDELDRPNSRELIKNLLEKSCEQIFKNEERQSKCDEYVEAYTDKLIDLIERADNPGLICNSLHMCPVNSSLVNEWDNKKMNKVIGVISNQISFRDEPIYKIDWCKVCKKTYPFLTDIVQIDEARNELRIMAHNLCDRRVLPINVTTCKTKADEYLNLIATVRDSDEGCQKLTLCPAAQNKISVEFDLNVIDLGAVESLSNDEISPLGWWNDAKCTACKLIIKGLYTNLNKTIHSPSTHDFIDRACEHLHEDELKDKCKADAIKALETLMKDFEQNLPPQQACELMAYCNKKTVSKTDLKPLLDNSACNSCKVLFPFLHTFLQNEKVRDTIRNITEKVCDSSNRPDDCKKILNDLIDSLADEETADKACANLCKTDLMITLGMPFSKCTRCQISMLALEHVFNSEIVRQKLHSTLEHLCETLNGENAIKCKHTIKSKLPELYEIVHKITDHDDGLCPTMGFCEKKKQFIDILSVTEVEDLLRGAEDLIPDEFDFLSDDDASNPRACECCKKTMGKINELIISKKDAKEKLLKLLLKTCPEKDDACRKFYRKSINYFYNELVRNTNPDRACRILGYCPNNKSLYEDEPNWKSEYEPNEDTVCKECESAVTYLVNTLNNRTVVDFLVKEVQQQACNSLKFVEKKACERLVKTFVPRFVKKFASKIDKNRICKQHLRLCKENASNMISNLDFVSIVEDSKCQVCQRSVARLNELRGESANRFSVEEICGEDSECSDFMFAFQEFLQADNTNSDPLIACSDLDVCLIPGRVQLLGSETKCNLGPSYWCMSAAHADACRATKFCKQTFWQTVAN